MIDYEYNKLIDTTVSRTVMRWTALSGHMTSFREGDISSS